jgi:TonB family protein
MNSTSLFENLVAYSLQIGLLVGLAAFVPALVRLRQPGGRLIYWQILLAACLLLPLQPWKQVMVTGSVLAPAGPAMAVQAVPHSAPAPQPLMPPSELVLLLMLAGTAVRLGWLAMGLAKLRSYRRHSKPLEPMPSWGVEAQLRLSPDVVSPVTFGWRKPVVLLQARFPQMDAAVQDAILCHEVLHVRRGDWGFTLAEELVRAALWFHPAIWWLLGEIGLAREQEVDRLAIEITKEREKYMDALLAIAGARAGLDLAPAPLFLRKRHLKQRVVLILQEARMTKTRLISALAAGLGILAAACWLITGTFPLTAAPQVVNDAPGVTVQMNGSTVLHRAAVNYPPAALQHGVQGTVAVQVKLDAGGNVSDAQVLSGPDELRKAALESVLQWHFTHNAAGSTRVVQIAFEAPKTAPAEAPIREIAPQAVTAPLPSRVKSILVVGLSDQARAELLASLPVHEGGDFNAEIRNQTNQAVKAFDEHLVVRFMPTHAAVGAVEADYVGILITAPAVEAKLGAPAPGQPLASATPSAAQGGPPPRIRVGGNVQAQTILTKVPPVYPELAKAARVSGVVQLAVVIGKEGTVQEVHSLGGPALLIQSAMDAVKQWTYRPTHLNGEAVEVETTVDVNFTLAQ